MLNKEHIENFKKTLEGKQKSSNTVDSYIGDVNTFYKYLESKKIDNLSQINQTAVENYIYGLKLSASTKNRKIASLKKYFNYLEDREIVNKNPLKRLEAVKIGYRESIYMNEHDMNKFIDYITLNCCFRDIVMSRLFLETGMRISEVVSLKVDSIDFKTNQLNIIGKGNKERVLFIDDSLLNMIKQYIDEDRVTKYCDNSLFIGRNGHGLKARRIEKIYKDIFTGCFGNDCKYTPHKLRHTFASAFYDDNKDIVQLQGILGHEGITTTKRYIHQELSTRKDAMMKNIIKKS